MEKKEFHEIWSTPRTWVQIPSGAFIFIKRGRNIVMKKVAAAAIVFWILNFVYQFYFFSDGNLAASLVRSFALSGAILLGLSLLASPVAILTRIKFAQHRRALGDWGFTFIIVHFLTVVFFYFNSDVSKVFNSLDPFTNLWLMGFIAFIVFIPVYISSARLVTVKLGRRWKNVQRLVYPAYILAVAHYVNINPAAVMTLPGYLLLLVTALVAIFQVVGFVKTVKRTKSKKAAVAGIVVILFALAVLLYSF